MAPSAPPLTREEFVSLRDGAKGLMHRIPSEHKARLIELGYIEEVSFNGCRQDEDRGGMTDRDPKLSRTLLSMQDLRWRTLAEIQKQPGCSNVRVIAINRVMDERAENNWSICVLSAGDADAKPRSVFGPYPQHRLTIETIALRMTTSPAACCSATAKGSAPAPSPHRTP
jgi:hypothetical protein